MFLFHTVLIYKFFCQLIKLLPANFLAGNFFIVYLQSVKTPYNNCSFLSSRQASLLFFFNKIKKI